MTFDELKKYRNSEKIILLELDLPILNDLLIAEQGGIWYKILTPEEISPFGSVFNPDRNQEVFFDIPSVKVIYNDEMQIYTKVSSYADLLTQEKGFWYNISNTGIYLHFDNFDPPLDRAIKLGTVNGFCSKVGSTNKGRYNDLFYEERVKNVPSIKFKKDPVTFGILEHQNVNYGLENTDGFFDDFQFGIKQISRQEARLYFGFDTLDRDNFELVHRSIIKDFTRTFSSYTVKGIDFRNQLNKSIPVNTYNTTDYPDMDADDEGEFIPLAYGVIKNAPCMQIDTSANTFKMCDTTYNSVVSGSVTAYKDGVAVSSGITYDYDEGTFTLSTYSDEEITADFQASTIENPLDIIKDLCENWGGVTFLDTNFNLTEWAKETGLNNNYKIGKYINDETKIIDAIADICKSSALIFFTERDGLYTGKSYNENKSITKRIHNNDWIDDPDEKNPQENFLSSVVIKYNKDVNNDEWSTYVNNDYKLEAIENYSIENTRTIETNLSDRDSAVDLSNEIMSIAKDIVPVVERTTNMEHFDIELMDFIEACHERDVDSQDFKVWEVIEIDYNFNKFQIKLTMRYVRDADIYSQGYCATNSNLGLNYCTNGGSGLTSGIGPTEYRRQ